MARAAGRPDAPVGPHRPPAAGPAHGDRALRCRIPRPGDRWRGLPGADAGRYRPACPGQMPRSRQGRRWPTHSAAWCAGQYEPRDGYRRHRGLVTW